MKKKMTVVAGSRAREKDHKKHVVNGWDRRRRNTEDIPGRTSLPCSCLKCPLRT